MCTLNKGEFVYIVGPSGAGKSTFIKMMYREEKPTKGSIKINGIELTTLKESKIPLITTTNRCRFPRL